MVFLAASALQISKDAIAKLHLALCPVLLASVLFVVAAGGLLISLLWSFIAVYRVLLPRGARFTPAQKGRDLMWQDHVLLHENNEEYFSAVRGLARTDTPQLTDQVFELAHKSKEKMDALTKIRSLIWLGFASCVVLIASGLLFGEALIWARETRSSSRGFLV